MRRARPSCHARHPPLRAPAGLNADRKLSTSHGTRSFTMRGKRAGSAGARMCVDVGFGTPIESVGKQALSNKRTAPAPALKSRTRFGSRELLLHGRRVRGVRVGPVGRVAVDGPHRATHLTPPRCTAYNF